MNEPTHESSYAATYVCVKMFRYRTSTTKNVARLERKKGGKCARIFKRLSQGQSRLRARVYIELKMILFFGMKADEVERGLLVDGSFEMHAEGNKSAEREPLIV